MNLNRANLRQVALGVERLRRLYDHEVILVVGCEFMLFTPGIVPGADFYERVEYLTKATSTWRSCSGGSARSPPRR